MPFAPTQSFEADALRPKTEARMRRVGDAFGQFIHVPNPGNSAPLPAIVARQTAITVPAPTGAGQHERPMT